MKGNILDWLERQAQRQADEPAVTDENGTLSWRQLRERAQTAGTFLAQYVKGNEPVAIAVNKSTDTLAAMLGAVYAGGFYVILDPTLPRERLANMVEVLRPCAVVVSGQSEKVMAEIADQAEDQQPAILRMEELFENPAQDGILHDRRERSDENDILYAVFTSGSTGTPKCVVVTHRCVIDFIGHFTELFSIDRGDVIANQAPFDFDVSVKDIYSSLYTGASLVLVPKMLFGFPGRLIDFLCEHRASVLTWAVSALSLVAAMGGLKYRVPDTVRKVMFSGEVMPANVLKQWMHALPQADFVNLYGPSEITCNCTYYKIPSDFDTERKLPVGGAFPGRVIRISDESKESGCDDQKTDGQKTGEICVEGESIAVGYYRNPVETDKRFYVTKDGIRGYKTGDIGYIGTDGLVYFAGRRDFQIKHMGHRIELEEIGRCMEKQDGVACGVCLFDEKKNRLVGFFMGEVEPALLRKQMKNALPAYMIPHKLYRLEKWPLNKNGKTDRQWMAAHLDGPETVNE